MTTDIEMLPLPEADDSVENRAQWPIVIDSDVWLQKSVQDYARAVAEHNVAAREAEWVKLNNLAGYFQDGSAETLRISPDDATRTWHVYRGAQRLGYGSTIHAALVDAMQGASDGQN